MPVSTQSRKVKSTNLEQLQHKITAGRLSKAAPTCLTKVVPKLTPPTPAASDDATAAFGDLPSTCSSLGTLVGAPSPLAQRGKAWRRMAQRAASRGGPRAFHSLSKERRARPLLAEPLRGSASRLAREAAAFAGMPHRETDGLSYLGSFPNSFSLSEATLTRGPLPS